MRAEPPCVGRASLPNADSFYSGPRNVSSAPRVRMAAEVDVAAAAVRHMRVQLGRAEVGVAEHLLDAPQVGAAFEEVRRKRVPEQVRVDTLGLEPRTAGEAPQDQKRARAREGAALCVQEELPPMPSVQERSTVGEVPPQRLDR